MGHGIIGDDYGTSLPETKVDEEQIKAEQAMQKYAQSDEYGRIKEHLQGRIDFYQKYLPDGRAVGAIPKKDLEDMWIVANCIIGEFETVIASYDQISEGKNAQ